MPKLPKIPWLNKIPWLQHRSVTPVKKTAVGLFLDKDGIACARLSRDHQASRPKLRAWDHRHFAQGLECEAVLREWCASYYLTGKSTIATLAPLYYRLFLIDSPEVEDVYLADALKWRVKELIEFPIEQALVDAFPLPKLPITDNGGVQPPKMAYVAVSPKSPVDEWIDRIESHDIFLEAMDIPELVIRNALAVYPDLPAHVAFLHIMPQGIQLMLLYQNQVYMTRSIDMDVYRFLAADGREKPGAGGGAMPPPSPDKTWDWDSQSHANGGLDDLANQIQRSFDYAMSEYQQERVEKILINPVAEYGEVVASFLRKTLALDVQMIRFEDFLDCKTDCPLLYQERTFLSVCAGLRGLQ